MPAPRRFIVDTPTEGSDFARDVLVESWRSLLPQGSVVLRARGLFGRLALIGSETVRLSTATATAEAGSVRTSEPVPAGSLAQFWHRSHGLPAGALRNAVAVTTDDHSAATADDLAAATVAVAGELGFDTITVVQVRGCDADATGRLVRVLRRLSDLTVSTVAHAGSTEITATTLASHALVVTHDATTAAVTESLGTPTARTTGLGGLTDLYLAVRSAATNDHTAAEPSRTARSLAYSLDAWARGRTSTQELRDAVAQPARVDDLVGV